LSGKPFAKPFDKLRAGFRASLLDAPFATVISSGVFGVEKSQAVGRARFLDFALRYASGYATKKLH